MKNIKITVKDINRKTSIPKEVMRKAVEKAYGVTLESPKSAAKSRAQKAA